MEQIKVNGLAVDKISGKGLKILFVHGANGGSWYWESYMKKFNSLGYDVYANNLRGHAPNPDLANLGQVSIFDYIADTKAVIDEVKPDILFGHSMGGLISQKLCSDYNFKAAIFAASAPPKGVRFRVAKPFSMMFYGMKQISALKKGEPLKLIYEMARKFALNNMTEERAKELFSKLVPESSKVGLEVGKNKVIQVAPDSIKCPILVIGAKKDKTAPWKMEKDLAKFYNADFHLFENNSHMFMVEENWSETADKIIKWLKSKGC